MTVCLIKPGYSYEPKRIILWRHLRPVYTPFLAVFSPYVFCVYAVLHRIISLAILDHRFSTANIIFSGAGLFGPFCPSLKALLWHAEWCTGWTDEMLHPSPSFTSSVNGPLTCRIQHITLLLIKKHLVSRHTGECHPLTGWSLCKSKNSLSTVFTRGKILANNSRYCTLSI